MKKLLLILFLTLSSIVYGQADNYPQPLNIDNQIIKHKAYTLSYNETCEQANWVKYRVTKTEIESKAAKRKNNFKADTLVKTGSASPDDYKGTIYDRGHLANAASFADNQDEMNESFYMSNMSPQEASFNRGIWKTLEEYERTLATEKDTVYVITGGILKGNLKTIGENKVCVPEFYYKIIYTKDFIVGYILKNEKSKDPIYMFKQPIEIIEQEAGINFMIK